MHDKTDLYAVSGIKSVTLYSKVSASTDMSGLWSPMSMLYDKIRLPFDAGSFQKTRMDRGVDVARTELTAAGLLIGVWDQLTLLNGPTPAEFTACRCTIYLTLTVMLSQSVSKPCLIKLLDLIKQCKQPDVSSK